MTEQQDSSVTVIGTGLLLRVGGRETVQQKARRYLLEGRVQIRLVGEHSVFAYVRGQGHIYKTGFSIKNGWRCNCPARGTCCHLIAVQLVISLPAHPTERSNA